MGKHIAILALATLVLAACGSAPQRKVETRDQPAPVEGRTVGASSGAGGYLPGDGPGKDAPANLDDIPDAEPKSEPLHRYANRPYVALGKTYTPMTIAGNYKSAASPPGTARSSTASAPPAARSTTCTA
jgi:rare lipoprotein A